MISFRQGERTVNLQAGDLWAAGNDKETYRDTSVEELWAIVHEVENGTPWREAVGRRYAQSNPWLHQIVTSPDRDLFFRLHPPQPGTRVLDIGAGWGQISLPLARTCEVTALEPTPERLAFIRAAAVQECVDRRLHFVQADFFEVEFDTKFDLVTCIGVLEWVPKFREGDPREVQIDFLRRASALLAPGGRLVVGIENRMGLKYLLGAPDDHLGQPNIAVYNAELAALKWQPHSGKALRVFTFTRIELAEMLSAAGLSDQRFFAALPDYKLPQRILPLGSEVDSFFREGGYVAEHDGSRGQPLSFQAELQSHYRSLAHLGVASDFVPSFYVSCQRSGG
jgi:2-polyprenyl-3-methyl-5-hydroxy-6-metoxy-1,4-benzoquinol methylase